MRTELAEQLGTRRLGTRSTVRDDGLRRLSVVYYAFRDGRILVSTLGDCRKASNVERTGGAALSAQLPSRRSPRTAGGGRGRPRKR
jgi:hypothetical protein